MSLNYLKDYVLWFASSLTLLQVSCVVVIRSKSHLPRSSDLFAVNVLSKSFSLKCASFWGWCRVFKSHWSTIQAMKAPLSISVTLFEGLISAVVRHCWVSKRGPYSTERLILGKSNLFFILLKLHLFSSWSQKK